jgi:hypothetical protein
MATTTPFGANDADHAVMASLVSGMRSDDAAVSAAQAQRVRRLAEAATFVAERTRGQAARVQDMAMRSIAAELACAMRVSDRTVLTQMNDALVMVEGFPATFAAWEAGRIGRPHALAVVEYGTSLPPEERAAFEAEAIPVCERETPGRSRPVLQLIAERLHPRTLDERHREAQEQRMVRVVPLGDGMADVIVTTTITLAHAIMDRLTRQATAINNARERARGAVAEAEKRRAGDGPDTRGAGDAGGGDEPTAGEIVASDHRTFDQIRADLVADMLLTSAPAADPTEGDGPGELGAIRAVVQVTVPVLTLMGTCDEPADLVGRSPIDPTTARRLAGGVSGWDRVLTHPITGAVLSVDRYRPTASMKRFLIGRDQRCRFPVCRMPAIWSDLDHTIDAARGGPTRDDNLGHECERHHTIKHATPWRVRQLPGGILEWTSPVGHVYTDLPPGADVPGATAASLRPHGVHFVPDGAPAPF